MIHPVKRGVRVNYYAVKESEVLQQLQSSPFGLSQSEAEARLKQYGPNELKKEKGISPVKMFLQQFNSSIVFLLLAAVIISLILHEKLDAIVIAAILVINTFLGFFQEYRAERAIEALKKMASPHAVVIRDNKQIKIDSKLLVPGDIIILESGDKVPADSRLLETYSLHAQEAALTGESQPVRKEVAMVKEDAPLGDRKNIAFSSTTITQGRGKAVIVGTAMQTEVGKIAKLIQEKEDKTTPLQKKMQELGKYLTLAVVAIAVIVFVIGILTGKELTVMFLTAIALAVAAIPEGLPAVITISLALGVQRMVKRNVLVRKLPSVETLGSVDVICSDKTGTLTHNQMTVTKLWVNNTTINVSGTGYEAAGKFSMGGKEINSQSCSLLLKIGSLCNDAQLQQQDQNIEVIGDPTEAALIISAEKAGFKREMLESQEPRRDEIPFSSERKMMTTIHQAGKGLVSYTKGAPDIIINLCDRLIIDGKIQKLDARKKQEILKQNEYLAAQALRILGFSYNEGFRKSEDSEKDMIFVGLQAMIDPPRAEVKYSIEKCQQAGIRVIMITGDHLITAQAIAQELGITGKALTGEELEKIDLETEIEAIGIFARVNPEHKLKIVDALKSKGHIVAMTGDGVNDAPALKKADIGVAMGISGTEVAKEASDMIIVDDNFTSIVNAVEEGRGVYDNIKKFFALLFSGNIGEIGIITLTIIGGLPLPLTPLLLLLVNLVTDGLPAVALGVDPFEPGAMSRKPRKATERFYDGLSLFLIFAPLIMTGLALLFFVLTYKENLAKAQTMVFLVIVLFEMFFSLSARSVRYPALKVGIFKNQFLWGAVLLSTAASLAVVYVPALQKIFHTAALSGEELLFIAAACSLGFIYLEVHKWIRMKKEAEATVKSTDF